jgi:hypothetical protein|nr:MAG TPA: hypothetical protein [Caudoviricetes sp.]
MALFGDLNLIKPKPLKFETKKEVKPKKSLREMAFERFGDDKKLLMQLNLFLDMCREKHLFPSKISWGMQLNVLEKFPKEARLEQVVRSITYGYRSIAYEENLKNYKVVEKEKEENIRYDLAF